MFYKPNTPPQVTVTFMYEKYKIPSLTQIHYYQWSIHITTVLEAQELKIQFSPSSWRVITYTQNQSHIAHNTVNFYEQKTTDLAALQ